MQRQLFIKIFILFQIVIFSGAVWAAENLLERVERESQEVAPITITSQKVDFDTQRKEAFYSGGVKVVKGNLTLNADSLKVFFQDSNQGVKSIQAYGTVKIWWKDTWAEAEEIIYNEQTQTIVLTGTPKAHQEGNTIKGEKIIYDLLKDKIIVEGAVETIFNLEPDLFSEDRF